MESHQTPIGRQSVVEHAPDQRDIDITTAEYDHYVLSPELGQLTRKQWGERCGSCAFDNSLGRERERANNNNAALLPCTIRQAFM